MKRKRTPVCFLCEKGGYAAECNGIRPCNVCIRNNTPNMCYGISLPQNPSTPPAPTGPPLSILPNANAFNPVPDQKKSDQSQIPVISQATPPTPPKKATRGRKTKAAKQLEKSNSNASDSANEYLMKEFKLMQENHQKLKEEMIALKMQNLKLDEKVTKLKNKTKDLITITNEKMNMHKLTEPSRVVYDLTQNPPKVQYANDLFCNMLGYHANEVIGEPWQKFIHTDFVERTIYALTNFSGDTIDQCYKHKTGGYFFTKDKYIIFRDTTGKAQLAFVEILPEQVAEEPTIPQLTFRKTPSQSIPINVSVPFNGNIPTRTGSSPSYLTKFLTERPSSLTTIPSPTIGSPSSPRSPFTPTTPSHISPFPTPSPTPPAASAKIPTPTQEEFAKFYISPTVKYPTPSSQNPLKPPNPDPHPDNANDPLVNINSPDIYDLVNGLRHDPEEIGSWVDEFVNNDSIMDDGPFITDWQDPPNNNPH